MAGPGELSRRDAGGTVEAESLDLTVGDLRLAARWLRPANGLSEPVFVFLHEALGSIGQWKAFPERLAEACGLPALIHERRGYLRGVQPAYPTAYLTGYSPGPSKRRRRSAPR